MAKKKKQYEESQSEITFEKKYKKKLCPNHWAREDQIDETLFEYWKNQEMTREEYEKIKSQVYREKN